MQFNLSTILRDAHAQARRLLTYGCFCGTYRQALAAGLTLSWQAAKAEREEAMWQATQPPIPADVADRIRELRDEAWASPITARGNELHAALLASARDLADTARASATIGGSRAAN